MKTRIIVEVCYAGTGAQFLESLEVIQGTSVMEAIEQSGVIGAFAELDIAALRLGIFGRFVDGNHVLAEHDRVEIYRPLRIDPKDARRRRAKGKPR